MTSRKSSAGKAHRKGDASLADLPTGQGGILDRLELPEGIARRLMELGFLPGHEVIPTRTAPGGGPRVYSVDGSEVALRRETASKLFIRRTLTQQAL